ncbi:class I SAM-dependent methyltransferase [Labrys neptuniae]
MGSRLDHHIRNLRERMRLSLAGRFGLARQAARDGLKIRQNRALLSAHFIRGAGIEIGGLARPLIVPKSAKVRYVDRMPAEALASTYAGQIAQENAVVPDIVDSAETLATIADGSQDFVIANHVIEHLENPLSFFRNASRVLKDGGVIYLALPNKEHTFDCHREVTPFSHLIEDFEKGPAASRRGHYEDYIRNSDTGQGRPVWSNEAAFRAQVEEFIADDVNIHFHVWDIPAMIEMIQNLRSHLGLPLSLVAMLESASEGIFIIRKR